MAEDKQDFAPSNASVIASEGVRNSAQDYADRTASAGHAGTAQSAQDYADRAHAAHVDATYKDLTD